MTGAPLEVRGLDLDYGRRVVLRDIDLSLAGGEMAALIGPNGAGKSSLLRCITALVKPRHGEVLIDGVAVERIEQFAKALLEGGRPADTPVLVVQHGTMASQRTLRATLADAPERIREDGIRPPAIIVIGSVAAFGG